MYLAHLAEGQGGAESPRCCCWHFPSCVFRGLVYKTAESLASLWSILSKYNLKPRFHQVAALSYRTVLPPLHHHDAMGGHFTAEFCLWVPLQHRFASLLALRLCSSNMTRGSLQSVVSVLLNTFQTLPMTPKVKPDSRPCMIWPLPISPASSFTVFCLSTTLIMFLCSQALPLCKDFYQMLFCLYRMVFLSFLNSHCEMMIFICSVTLVMSNSCNSMDCSQPGSSPWDFMADASHPSDLSINIRLLWWLRW